MQTDRDTCTIKITFMEGNNVAETKTSSLKAANGIFLSLLSTISASFTAEFVALARKDGLPRFQILFLMRLTELLGLMCVAAFCRPRFTGENRHQNTMLFLILSNVTMIALFLSFTYTVPGIAFGIIKGSMLFFVACVGFLFFKEALILVDACGILINVTGVVLVVVGMTQIGAMPTKLLVLSISIPLLASLVFAPDMVLMRYLTGTLRMSIVTALLYSDLVGTVALLVITYAAETPICTMPSRTVFYVVGFGVTKLIAALTVFASLKVVKAYISTAVRMFVVPISLLLDYLFMQEIPNPPQGAGDVRDST